jgi:hypothetical protein
MRTPEDILTLANKAMRAATRGHVLWTDNDRDDMRQEAAAAICALAGERTDALCVHVAKHAIYDWMRFWLRTPRAGSLLDWVDYSAPPDPSWPLDYLDALPPLLEAQRAEKVEEDMAYLRLRLQGYSIIGIAQELGITQRNAEAIRERTVPRLKRIARGEGPPPIAVNVHENSRATLDRINRDPEALARRGEAIRAGWARRKQQLQESRP